MLWTFEAMEDIFAVAIALIYGEENQHSSQARRGFMRMKPWLFNSEQLHLWSFDWTKLIKLQLVILELAP
jgi:hypothetical protein